MANICYGNKFPTKIEGKIVPQKEKILPLEYNDWELVKPL